MQDMASSDSALRRSAEEIRSQLRENTAAEKANRELLAVLQAAQSDPGKLIATSNHLLDSQPSLRRLKEGLIDSQLRTSTLLGTMSDDHPRVKVARETEEEIGRHLHRELELASRGVNIELRLNGERSTLLNEQLAKTLQRLDRLAAVRATYANEVAEVKNRSTILERSEQNLAEARASQASAKASSLVSRIDAPDAGIRPIGPPRTAIALSGVLGGLLAGFGCLFLCVPLGSRGELPATTANDCAAAPAAGEYWSTAPSTSDRFHAIQTENDPINNGRLSLKQALQKLGNGRLNRRP
jgi:uncharacterized protein involved in exopolysaccharide biosynthesis